MFYILFAKIIGTPTVNIRWSLLWREWLHSFTLISSKVGDTYRGLLWVPAQMLVLIWMEVWVIYLLFIIYYLSSLSSSVAPIPPSNSIQARREPRPDCGSCLPHAPSLLLSWSSTQHCNVGASGTSQNPETLESELPEASTPTQTISCPLL